ncbi:MAG: lysylphosphatidylglycerol synthase transmembrane domain-containing protein [Chloroflexota bacterium]
MSFPTMSIAKEQETTPTLLASFKKVAPWLRVGLSLLLGIGGLWLITRNVDLAEVGRALGQAHLEAIALGLLVILVTILAKTWRWRLLFAAAEDAPRFRALFWALVLGQFINLLLPFRLGDLTRIYTLHQETQSGKARALGTLVVEKTLDTVMLALTLLVLLPLVVVPRFVSEPGLTMTVIAVLALGLLYAVAYQTERVVSLLQQLARLLPLPLERRLMRLAVGGLSGLASLRNRRLMVTLFLSSAAIAGLSVLTPLVLFATFDLPLGLVEAVLLNLVLSLGSTPPSTPAKVGVFEWLVAFTLGRFGLTDNVIIVSYALIYHTVVILPQIVLGSAAVFRTHWRPGVTGNW